MTNSLDPGTSLDDRGPSFLGCLISHNPRYNDPYTVVDVTQKCILGDFDFALKCNPDNRLNLSKEFDDYIVKVCEKKLNCAWKILQKVIDSLVSI